MTIKDLEAYKHTLKTQQRTLAPTRTDLQAIATDRLADSTDDSALENERHVALAACSRKATLLLDVREALERTSAGTYGLCLECGKPISAKRLSAMPWARLCLSCQEETERDSLVAERYVA